MLLFWTLEIRSLQCKSGNSKSCCYHLCSVWCCCWCCWEGRKARQQVRCSLIYLLFSSATSMNWVDVRRWFTGNMWLCINVFWFIHSFIHYMLCWHKWKYMPFCRFLCQSEVIQVTRNLTEFGNYRLVLLSITLITVKKFSTVNHCYRLLCKLLRWNSHETALFIRKKWQA